jgi:hypothetical protein
LQSPPPSSLSPGVVTFIVSQVMSSTDQQSISSAIVTPVVNVTSLSELLNVNPTDVVVSTSLRFWFAAHTRASRVRAVRERE